MKSTKSELLKKAAIARSMAEAAGRAWSHPFLNDEERAAEWREFKSWTRLAVKYEEEAARA